MSQQILPLTDDTTLDDLCEMRRLDELPDTLRELAARHVQDQFDAVPSFLERFKDEREHING